MVYGNLEKCVYSPALKCYFTQVCNTLCFARDWTLKSSLLNCQEVVVGVSTSLWYKCYGHPSCPVHSAYTHTYEWMNEHLPSSVDLCSSHLHTKLYFFVYFRLLLGLFTLPQFVQSGPKGMYAISSPIVVILHRNHSIAP